MHDEDVKGCETFMLWRTLLMGQLFESSGSLAARRIIVCQKNHYCIFISKRAADSEKIDGLILHIHSINSFVICVWLCVQLIIITDLLFVCCVCLRQGIIITDTVQYVRYNPLQRITDASVVGRYWFYDWSDYNMNHRHRKTPACLQASPTIWFGRHAW